MLSFLYHLLMVNEKWSEDLEKETCSSWIPSAIRLNTTQLIQMVLQIELLHLLQRMDVLLA